MAIRSMKRCDFREGDLVTVNSLDERLRFCIIGWKHNIRGQRIAVLKGLFNNTFIIEKPVEELKSLLLRGRL